MDRTDKEAKMHPMFLEHMAQQHIEDLHRDAARRRLAVRPRKAKRASSKASAGRLQRAPAHS